MDGQRRLWSLYVKGKFYEGPLNGDEAIIKFIRLSEFIVGVTIQPYTEISSRGQAQLEIHNKTGSLQY